jgi:molybdopterin converting factor small subunit
MAEGIRVRLFAQAREAVGQRELRCPVPVPDDNVDALLKGLRAEHPRLGPVLRSCRFALNGKYIDDPATTRLADGDELGVHPPYSGG